MTNKINTKAWLNADAGFSFVAYVIFASFMTYFCMYAFRKPFSAAMFSGEYIAGISIKIWFIAAQVAGYTLSKFIGIKVVSEMTANRRAKVIFGLVLSAEISLLFFAIVPIPYKIFFMFLNGLPLGIIWGLVFAYLEGRRFTELLGAGLSVSFIFSSGIVKSTGKWLIVDFGISDYWMPFLTGAIFIIPLTISVILLNKIPAPSARDEKMRTQRKPMNKTDRGVFFQKFAHIIIVLIMVYSLLTIFREMRDNFAAEIWEALGMGNDPSIFTKTEIPVGIGVLICMACITFIKDNSIALYTIQFLIIIGFAIVGLSTFLFQLGQISGKIWMILIGLGLYLGYIPFNALLFERMIAGFHYVGNIGFIMYLADSFGYLSSISVFIFKNFVSAHLSWLQFFMRSSYILAFSGIFLTALSIWLLQKSMRTDIKKIKLSYS